MEPAATTETRPVALPVESVGHHWTILILSSAVLSLGLLLRLDGTTGVRLPGPPVRLPEVCLLQRMLSLDCPGCGLTRSVIAIMHGNLDSAFQFNPAGPLMFLLIALQIPIRLVAIWRIRVQREPLYVPGGLTALGFVMFVLLVQWLVRACFGFFVA